MTIREALCLAPRFPRLDREVLLSHVLGQDRVFLMAHGEEIIAPRALKRYQKFIARAKRHEPIAYVIGTKEFYGRDFFVGPGVLIPRPETELIVERAIKEISARPRTKKKCAVIDVGTGSGAIITSVFLSLESKVRKNISWFAIDNEINALRYARKNAREHHVEKVIQFKKSDLLSAIEKRLSQYDEIFVIANLPYLSTALYRRAAPNVKRYEPKSALLSGTDGLNHYRRLMAELRTINAAGTNISFFLEISPEQAKKLPELFRDTETLSALEIVPDLAGKPRLVIGRL